jgi:hypothetical protein
MRKNPLGTSGFRSPTNPFRMEGVFSFILMRFIFFPIIFDLEMIPRAM